MSISGILNRKSNRLLSLGLTNTYTNHNHAHPAAMRNPSPIEAKHDTRMRLGKSNIHPALLSHIPGAHKTNLWITRFNHQPSRSFWRYVPPQPSFPFTIESYSGLQNLRITQPSSTSTTIMSTLMWGTIRTRDIMRTPLNFLPGTPPIMLGTIECGE